MVSKEQEIKALENIKATISTLGKDSYVATAFDGCIEIAEENIENDFGCSMKGQNESLMQSVEKLTAEINALKTEVNALKSKNTQLEKELDKELEWEPYINKNIASQEDYERLANNSGSKFLSDDEAKDLIYEWFGFAREKIKILRTLDQYLINRHSYLRKIGEIERRPVYNSTDWYYIIFECGGVTYEICDDDINVFCN